MLSSSQPSASFGYFLTLPSFRGGALLYDISGNCELFILNCIYYFRPLYFNSNRVILNYWTLSLGCYERSLVLRIFRYRIITGDLINTRNEQILKEKLEKVENERNGLDQKMDGHRNDRSDI